MKTIHREHEITCHRCGEEHTLTTIETPATHEDPSEEEEEEKTCECGNYLTGQDEDKSGIKFYLEDYELTEDIEDNNGYLYVGGGGKWRYLELYELPCASEELKYFIKGERPKEFKEFRLWNGTVIKGGE